MIYNIRPYNFKTKFKGFQPFNTKDKFLKAIRDTIEKYRTDANQANEWLREVNTNYAKLLVGSMNQSFGYQLNDVNTY